MLRDITKVLGITISPRCGNDERALVDPVGLIDVAASFRKHHMGAKEIDISVWSSIVCGFRGCGRWGIG